MEEKRKPETIDQALIQDITAHNLALNRQK